VADKQLIHRDTSKGKAVSACAVAAKPGRWWRAAENLKLTPDARFEPAIPGTSAKRHNQAELIR